MRSSSAPSAHIKPSLTLSSAALSAHRSAELGLTRVTRPVPRINRPPLLPTPPIRRESLTLSTGLTLAASVRTCDSCGKRDDASGSSSTSSSSTSSHLCKHCGVKHANVAIAVSRAPTLAQRLGLRVAPREPPSQETWMTLATRARTRGACSHCAICRERLGLRASVLTSCSHVFHATCVSTLSRHANTAGLSLACPLCREPAFYCIETDIAALSAVIAAVRAIARLARRGAARREADRLRWALYVEAAGSGGKSTVNKTAFLARALSSTAAGAVLADCTLQRGATARALNDADTAVRDAASAAAAFDAVMARRQRPQTMSQQRSLSAGAQAHVVDGSKGLLPPPPPLSKSPSAALSDITAALVTAATQRLLQRVAARSGTRDALRAAAITGDATALDVVASANAATHVAETRDHSNTLLDGDWESRARTIAMTRGAVNDECCVCLESLNFGGGGGCGGRVAIQCALLACGHVLHSACADAFESIALPKRLCPLCRMQYFRCAL